MRLIDEAPEASARATAPSNSALVCLLVFTLLGGTALWGCKDEAQAPKSAKQSKATKRPGCMDLPASKFPADFRQGCAGKGCETIDCGGHHVYFYSDGRFLHSYACDLATRGKWRREGDKILARGTERFDAESDCGRATQAETDRCVRNWTQKYGRSKVVIRTEYEIAYAGERIKATWRTTEESPVAGKPYLKEPELRGNHDFGCLKASVR